MEQWGIGVDLGGTKIEIALVNNNGLLLDHTRFSTNKNRTPEAIIADIKNGIDSLSQKHDGIKLAAAGIGVAGQVERHTGTVRYAPNLQWHNINLGQQLSQEIGIPVAVCNDVRAAAWGEWLWGAGKDCTNMVCIFVGTGVGGAIVSGGKMIEGCNNTAGEIGHITVERHGPLCTCGNKGCLEALAGGWAIQRDAQQAVLNNKTEGQLLVDLAKGNIDAITAATVVTAALQGNHLAATLMENVADALAAGVTSITNMLGPCRVIFGGGIIEGMPQLITHIDKKVRAAALESAIANVTLVPAQLHNNAGSIGAATYALHMQQQ